MCASAERVRCSSRKAELGGIAAQEIGIKPETQEILNQIIADIEV